MREIVAASINAIEHRIFLVRGMRVMLSIDLAEIYGVEPRVLVQAVKRNIERFPADFMFQLSDQEFINLKSQIVISSWGGIRRATPYAFTEQGVAMLYRASSGCSGRIHQFSPSRLLIMANEGHSPAPRKLASHCSLCYSCHIKREGFNDAANHSSHI